MEAILASLPSLINAGFAILNYIGRVRAAARQTGEWTPELEQYYQTLLEAAKTAPQWQPDPPKPADPLPPPA